MSPLAPEPSWSCRPLQSLASRWSSEHIGLPAPGTASALASALPTRYSCLRPRPRTRLLGPSSHGVQSSFTALPESPPRASRRPAPLLGFPAPSAFIGPVHPRPPASKLPSLRLGSPGSSPGRPSAAPQPPTTVSLAGFPNLSATCSAPDLPTIFRWVTLVGFFPSGVCSSLAASTARHRRYPLMTFFPFE